ncbi:MAG: enoyl-CoA hydratase/isomerase family protein [Gammaproteobacteria bacterium]|nr:enoyl-CoA hydratase/isomerase family protein [Gammaproteobacteria bacterium]
MSEYFKLERRGRVAIVTMDRAERHNAINRPMMRALIEVAHSFEDDEDTRAVVLRAAGENFSFGADLDEMGGGESRPSIIKIRRQAELGAKLMRALRDIHQPTICAVQGISTGGATCIATACDFRIASREARMGYGEVKLGMNLMWHALPTCVQLVGPSRAKQLIMSGRLVPAETLVDWGLVDEVCEREALDARALKWAEEYAALPPISVQMIKRSINRFAGALDEAVMHADADQWLIGVRSGDFREGIRALKEKQPGQFRGD